MAEPLTSEHLEAVDAFLAAQSTLALATVDGEARPQVAPLFFVHDGEFNLYWLSSPSSRHSVSLSLVETVAATIYPEVWGWQQIRGVQIEGVAQAVEDDIRRDFILDLYRAKFNLPEAFEAEMAATTLYVLEPQWLRWLDNSERFGFKAEGVL